jgi:hypothetical protein
LSIRGGRAWGKTNSTGPMKARVRFVSCWCRLGGRSTQLEVLGGHG